jgi:hypothetical protein
MKLQPLTQKDFAKAIGIGIGTAVLLSLIMVPAFMAGISPMPQPLGLAFARLLLGNVPLPVGLLFHVFYVTFWSVLFVAYFERRTFLNALWLALGLWILVLVLFFPLVGWGFLGLAVSPMLIVASLVLHILFALILWGLSRWAFPANAQDRLAGTS